MIMFSKQYFASTLRSSWQLIAVDNLMRCLLRHIYTLHTCTIEAFYSEFYLIVTVLESCMISTLAWDA